jgi:hypothetical protein
MIALFCFLLLGHYLMDYPLQGPFIAQGKNPFDPIPHIPWYQIMFAHTFMHAMAVYVILGVWWIAALELVIHFATDYFKCKGELTFNQDQSIHMACKIVWVLLFAYMV